MFICAKNKRRAKSNREKTLLRPAVIPTLDINVGFSFSAPPVTYAYNPKSNNVIGAPEVFFTMAGLVIRIIPPRFGVKTGSKPFFSAAFPPLK